MAADPLRPGHAPREKIRCKVCDAVYFADTFDPAGACEHIRDNDDNAETIKRSTR